MHQFPPKSFWAPPQQRARLSSPLTTGMTQQDPWPLAPKFPEVSQTHFFSGISSVLWARR